MAFPSVYEMTNPLTTVRKQSFWDYFSGATVQTPRTWKTTLVGSATISIADEVNGGVKLSTTGANQKATMSTGGDGNPASRQFYYQNCTFIASFRFDATQASTIQAIALSNGTIGSPRDSGLNYSRDFRFCKWWCNLCRSWRWWWCCSKYSYNKSNRYKFSYCKNIT